MQDLNKGTFSRPFFFLSFLPILFPFICLLKHRLSNCSYFFAYSPFPESVNVGAVVLVFIFRHLAVETFFFGVMKHERADKKGESAPVDLHSLTCSFHFPIYLCRYPREGHTHPRARALRNKAACGHIPRKKWKFNYCHYYYDCLCVQLIFLCNAIEDIRFYFLFFSLPRA